MKDFGEMLAELYGHGGYNPQRESDKWELAPVCAETHRFLGREEIERDNLDPDYYVYLKPDGGRAIDRVFFNPSRFCAGFATVLREDNDGCFFINEQGEEVFTDLEVKNATGFIAGLCLVHFKNGDYGYIDREGQRVVTS